MRHNAHEEYIESARRLTKERLDSFRRYAECYWDLPQDNNIAIEVEASLLDLFRPIWTGEADDDYRWFVLCQVKDHLRLGRIAIRTRLKSAGWRPYWDHIYEIALTWARLYPERILRYTEGGEGSGQEAACSDRAAA